MDKLKNYVGKVVRLQFLNNGEVRTKTGIVYKQDQNGDRVSFSMLLTNGQVWSPWFDSRDQLKISFVRIDENLRKALTDFCKVKMKQEAFLKQFLQEKTQHENNVETAISAVKELSDEITVKDCMDAFSELFRQRYPSSGYSHHLNYFDCRSASPSEVTVCHCQEIDKYATPEQYSFLYREYDDTMHIHCEGKDYKNFCERNAPAVKPELEKFKSKIYATIGDKNFLEVQRAYIIPLKYGLSKRSIDHIKETVFGIKKLLKDAISAANEKKKDHIANDRSNQNRIKEVNER